MTCIYCRSIAGPFTRIEHIIPESLGNDQDLLPLGAVCDACNQYFGAKVEQIALSSMPFAVERITGAVKNKRGKTPSIPLEDGVTLEPTTEFDVVRVSSGVEKVNIDPFTGRPFLKRQPSIDRDRALARMLVKIGLGLMAKPETDYDPLDARFDDAREFARSAPRGVTWGFAQGDIVDRSRLITDVTSDRLGAPLITHKVYEWQIREEKSGHVFLMFQFRGTVFFIYLTRRDLGDFIERHKSRLPLTLIARSGGTPAS